MSAAALEAAHVAAAIVAAAVAATAFAASAAVVVVGADFVSNHRNAAVAVDAVAASVGVA